MGAVPGKMMVLKCWNRRQNINLGADRWPTAGVDWVTDISSMCLLQMVGSTTDVQLQKVGRTDFIMHHVHVVGAGSKATNMEIQKGAYI